MSRSIRLRWSSGDPLDRIDEQPDRSESAVHASNPLDGIIAEAVPRWGRRPTGAGRAPVTLHLVEQPVGQRSGGMHPEDFAS